MNTNVNKDPESKELKFSIHDKTLLKIENFIIFIKSLQLQRNKLNPFEMVDIIIKKTNFLDLLHHQKM